MQYDWPLLRAQKQLLLALCDRACSPEEAELLEGVVCLLDALQDAAVDNGEATEEAVFGNTAHQQSPIGE